MLSRTPTHLRPERRHASVDYIARSCPAFAPFAILSINPMAWRLAYMVDFLTDADSFHFLSCKVAGMFALQACINLALRRALQLVAHSAALPLLL